MFPLRSTALALCLGAFLSAAPSSAAVIRLGVVTTTEPGFAATTVTPVVSEMEKLRPHDVVHVVQIAEHDLLHDIERERPDLLICSAWCFLNVLNDIGAHPVATRKTDRAASAVASIGAALVVRSDRADLRTLEDLRGKKAAATLPHSVDGFPAVRLMLREKGFSDEKFFSGVNFLTFTVPDVLSAVLSGDADVSILPACALERAQEEGLVESGLLRVVGLPPDGALACSRSTALYPDITAGILPWTPNELTRDFLSALLESGHADGYEWVATSDLRSVSNLYQELHLGRWAVLDDASLSGLWKRYGRYAIFVLLLVLFLVANEYRLKRLVEHRTAALTKTLREKELLARKEEAARERLASLERMGAISQLCAMIAHELKQPMGAVLNFLAVLKMRSGEALRDDPVAERAMEGAQNEARRMAEIVDRVRGYAKRQRRTPEPVDLGRTIDEALSHLKPGPKTSVCREVAPNVFVAGDPLELELLVLNLVKNAVQALDAAEGGTVTVTLARTDEFGAQLRVTDDGPTLSDEIFAKLLKVSESVKEGGLGLGLAIVRNIVDEHGATLSIERLPERGLAVTVRFDTLNPNAPANNEPAGSNRP